MTVGSGPVAVLYQATPPPVIDGIRKPMKPTGYADSGADIAHALRDRGIDVITPATDPDPADDTAWVFPDTPEGIAHARTAGAAVLWANTVLFSGHPLDDVLGDVAVVGQRPSAVHRFDDKWHTNELLRADGGPVARAMLVSEVARDGVVGADTLSEHDLAAAGMTTPVVVKPIRGRGSQGVTVVDDLDELRSVVKTLLAATDDIDGQTYRTYGDTFIVEEYLSGTEVTMTVMPPGVYAIDGQEETRPAHWVLPPVERFGHVGGITPYNGVVAVTANSVAVEDPDDAQIALGAHCARAGALVGALAPIRVDCRARPDGHYAMFDLNMKPNMTGAGRPGRDDQDSLSAMAARLLGWSFGDLLENMLRQAWRDESSPDLGDRTIDNRTM